MHWNLIHSMDDVNNIVNASHSKPQVIFKHSTSCSISSMAKMRLEDDISNLSSDVDFHYLDLISYRTISNGIAEILDVHHESPQIILIHLGEVIYDASHFDISIEELNESLSYHFAKR